MSKENENTVREINDAFMVNDTEKFLSFCDDGFTWKMAGETLQQGKDNIRKWMSGMEDCEPPRFTVDRMISDDDSVVCFGDMTMKDKEGTETAYSYCDIYKFADGKVVDLRSFVVKEKEQE